MSASPTGAVASHTTRWKAPAFSGTILSSEKSGANLQKKRTFTILLLLTQVEKVLQYNYTTAEKSTDKMVEDSGIFGSMMEAVNRTSSGPMHGFGVGLPCSAAYSEYLGGELTIQSMQVCGGVSCRLW